MIKRAPKIPISATYIETMLKWVVASGLPAAVV